tara:strand:- start:164 stop:691 length:528 start_codon:yes stop_codon:yes gene_type:complete
MVEFVLTINDKNGKSYKKEVASPESDVFLNKRLKDDITGDSIGLKGYGLKITGGSDTQGFPIREDVIPGTRKRPLVVSGIGAKSKDKGVKQRKTVRGNIIDDNIKQINLKVEKEGANKLEEVFGNSGEKKMAEESSVKVPSEEKKEVPEESKSEIKENTGESNKDEGKESEETEK